MESPSQTTRDPLPKADRMTPNESPAQGSTTYALTGLHCKACVGRIERALAPLAKSARVDLSPMQVVLWGVQGTAAQLASAVAQAGAYTLVVDGAQANAPATATANPPLDAAPNTPPTTPSNATPGFLETYRPLLLLVGFILGASVLVQTAHGSATTAETMRLFMAGFFLTFSFFKLLDVRAFASAYAGYDLLAARWPTWGFIYPFVELALGVAYLSHFAPTATHIATLVVMGFSALGVIQAVAGKRKIQCACLGTVFKLPMSTVTIVEDLGMFAMAAWMLWV